MLKATPMPLDSKKFRRFEIAIFLCFWLLSGLAAGQEEPTFRTQSNVVLVPALIRDKAGEAVYGLQAKDFIIEDDGVAQTVHLDEAAEVRAGIPGRRRSMWAAR